MKLKNNIKLIEETYQEDFHRPDGLMRLLTKQGSALLRALYRLNYFKQTKDETNEITELFINQ
tara:strand:- start:1078 stop:1266 length:189 start_codon:yes stop_codon:yes gene_type:complete